MGKEAECRLGAETTVRGTVAVYAKSKVVLNQGDSIAWVANGNLFVSKGAGETPQITDVFAAGQWDRVMVR